MNSQAGYVTIIGHPNAGKSTLLNAIIGEKISIVSPKIQTTRHRIKAIYNKENLQIIFSDTPGILKPLYLLHEKMFKQINFALADADILLYLIDGKEKDTEYYQTLFSYKPKKPIPFFVVVNKIDKMTEEEKENIIQLIKNEVSKADIFFLSAIQKKGLQEVFEYIKTLLPKHPFFYDGDEITDRNLRFLCSELVREQIFYCLDKELPYQIAIVVQNFKEKEKMTVIKMDIVVNRESQRIIVLGKGGSMIKKIGIKAREEIEKLVKKKVFIELYVKIKPNWRNNPAQLKEYGYEE
ncbi:MAG: GTPase Era [Chitinophagaceae bacterium]